MGSGVSSRRSLTENESIRHQYVETTIFKNGKIFSPLKKRYVDIKEEKLFVIGDDGGHVLQMDIDHKLEISYDQKQNNISIRDSENTLSLTFTDREYASNWYRLIQEELIIFKTKLIESQGRGVDRLFSMFNLVDMNEEYDEEAKEMNLAEESNRAKVMQLHDTIPPPVMKIVILVVGTRGDVQPFVNLGLELKSRGHVVRVATHSEYRQDVLKEGLLYYPLAGKIDTSLTLLNSVSL
jgi:hypothetical protein